MRTLGCILKGPPAGWRINGLAWWKVDDAADGWQERRRDRKAEICDVDCPIHYLLYQSFDSHSQLEVTQIYIRKGSCCCICRFTPINTTMLFFFFPNPFKSLIRPFCVLHLVWIWYIYSKVNFRSLVFFEQILKEWFISTFKDRKESGKTEGKTRSKGPLYSSPVAPCGHLLTHWVKVAPNPVKLYVTKHVTRYLRWVTTKYSNKTHILHTISGPLGIQA